MSLSSRLALAAASVSAAAVTIGAGPPETGYDRPGGVYSNQPATDAAACAIACAQDRICMSWTFRVAEYVGCSLKAVVPPAVPDKTAVSGLAERAGDFLSLVSMAQPAPAPPPASLAVSEPSAPASPPAADPTPDLLGAPAALIGSAGIIGQVNYRQIAFARDLQEAEAPLLEIPVQGLAEAMLRRPLAPAVQDVIAPRALPFESASVIMAPIPFATASYVSPPSPRPLIRSRAISFETAALILPPEQLDAPPPFPTALAGLARISYHPSDVARALPTTPTPIVEIETARPFASAMVSAVSGMRAAQTPRALNDHVVLALPDAPLAQGPAPSVVPASFTALDKPASPQIPAQNQQEEELFGGP